MYTGPKMEESNRKRTKEQKKHEFDISANTRKSTAFASNVSVTHGTIIMKFPLHFILKLEQFYN